MNADKWEKALLKDNFIDEKGMFTALICVGALEVGPNQKRVRSFLGPKRWSPANEKKFRSAWKNLRQGGYFHGGKIAILEEGEKEIGAIHIALMTSVAEGYIERKMEK